MMVEYIDAIANCVMALLAVVAFIVAFSEYCLHKRELIDVYLERSIACCQKMLEHSSRFWGYAPIFCGNAELAAAQYYLSRNPELKGSEEDVIAPLTYNECLLQAQEEQKNFSLLQTEMEEMRAFQRLLASYLKIICSLQNESHGKKREKVQIRKICIALNEISESYVGSVFVAYFDFSNADNRHIFKKRHNSNGFSDKEIRLWENEVIGQSESGTVPLKTLLDCKMEVLNSANGDSRYTLNLSDELFHSVEKRFIDCLAELTKLIARTIAKALRLNEDLVEAIALGHDLGHTPFGHAGERALDAVNPDGFAHYKQSVRVAQVLEKNGEGLNLTWEVRDGILNHRTSGNPSTLEGKVVRLSDKIAYIHHDMDDAQRAGIISEDDIPVTLRMLLGYTTRERLNTFVHDVIENSLEQDTIKMSAEIYEAMMDLRALMFQNVYENPAAHKEEEKVVKMLTELYEYYVEYPEAMSKEYRELIVRGEKKEQAVCDYLSGMTDQYSIRKFREIYIPKAWEVY